MPYLDHVHMKWISGKLGSQETKKKVRNLQPGPHNNIWAALVLCCDAQLIVLLSKPSLQETFPTGIHRRCKLRIPRPKMFVFPLVPFITHHLVDPLVVSAEWTCSCLLKTECNLEFNFSNVCLLVFWKCWIMSFNYLASCRHFSKNDHFFVIHSSIF